MKMKKTTLIFTVIFTITMIMLTLFARKIRNYFILPNVSIKRLTTEQFEINTVMEDGTKYTVVESELAINKEVYDKNDEFFIIEYRNKNGELRSYAKLINIVIDGENAVSYRVLSEKSTITKRDYLIITSNKALSDGDEVFITVKLSVEAISDVFIISILEKDKKAI